VSQKLLDKLGVHTLREQQSGTRVPKVVEADGVGETGLPKKRLEGASDEVVVAQWSTDGRAEHKIIILPELRKPGLRARARPTNYCLEACDSELRYSVQNRVLRIIPTLSPGDG
jgi:hypothetical protein